MQKLGIPKEIKALEHRVGMTPDGVREITAKGFPVVVQAGAGLGSGFSDDDYRKAGADIVSSLQEVYAQATVIQKVKEPLAAEYPLIRREHILFSYLHLASPENCALVKVLMASGAAAVAYETLEVNGRLPLLAPMSEIAGSLAVAYAAYLLKNPSAKGLTAAFQDIAARYPDFAGLPPAGRVVVWGGGVAGQNAMETALRLKGEVAVIEKNEDRRKALKALTPSVFGPEDIIDKVLTESDVWVGSVHARGQRAFQVISLEKMREASRAKKKVIVDISVDQGGNFPETRATSYESPVFTDSCGNLRFCVANMPSLCGPGASRALAAASLPYTLEILSKGLSSLENASPLARAVNIAAGKILIPAIQEAHKL